VQFLKYAWAVIAVVVLVGCEGEISSDQTGAVESDIGMRRLRYVDETRPAWSGETSGRPVNAWAWYPAQEPGPAALFDIPEKQPVFIGGSVVRDAEIKDGKHPLVVMSHGTGGSAFQMMWLGRRLAAAGYIAIAIDHHGNTAAEDKFDPRGFLYFWERPQDITILLDRVLADPVLKGSIDAERIGAAGFSLGGYSVVASVGGRGDFEHFEAFCASEIADSTCDPQTEYPNALEELEALIAEDPAMAADRQGVKADYRDPRIGAVVAIAPAIAQMFTTDSLEAITVDMLVLVGDADDVAPAATNAERIAEHVQKARLETFPGATHYTFLNECTARGRRFVRVCRDGPSVNRAAVHDAAANAAIAHFSASMGPADRVPQSN
jgi:predicted dienelactone hydrolase